MYIQKLKSSLPLKDNRLRINYGVKFIDTIGYINFLKNILYMMIYIILVI
jgi:hypothetical protein